MNNLTAFLRSSIGKKMLMAVSGIFLIIFNLGHVIGNLQIFLGAEVLNEYAHKLRALGPGLYIFRTVMFIALVVHVWTAIQLTLENKRARGNEAYRGKGDAGAATLASRTLFLTGLLIMIYLLIHLQHFTWGGFNPEWDVTKPGDNVIAAFQSPIQVILYLLMMVVVGLHLSHGIQSLFQSLGLNHPQYTPKIKTIGGIVAWAIAVLYAIIPIGVIAGMFH